MSDAFEIRLQLVQILRKLSSSQNSIDSSVKFMLKHSSKCGTDLWECLVEECEKANLNSRINVLYMLDTLLLNSSSQPACPYPTMIQQDLSKIVNAVVPPIREGLLNWMSTKQVLMSWKRKRALPLNIIEPIETMLADRQAMFLNKEPDASAPSGFAKFSKSDVLQRIMDDRERHKRLRERIWVLPIPSLHTLSQPPLVNRLSSIPPSKLASLSHPNTPASPFSPSSPSTQTTVTTAAAAAAITREVKTVKEREEDPIDAEFEHMWSNFEDGELGFDDLDWERMQLETVRCYGTSSTVLDA